MKQGMCHGSWLKISCSLFCLSFDCVSFSLLTIAICRNRTLLDLHGLGHVAGAFNLYISLSLALCCCAFQPFLNCLQYPAHNRRLIGQQALTCTLPTFSSQALTFRYMHCLQLSCMMSRHVRMSKSVSKADNAGLWLLENLTCVIRLDVACQS